MWQKSYCVGAAAVDSVGAGPAEVVVAYLEAEEVVHHHHPDRHRLQDQLLHQDQQHLHHVLHQLPKVGLRAWWVKWQQLPGVLQ